MSPIDIEIREGDRAILTPDLRLRFQWHGGRWTHVLDLGPGSWQAAVGAVERQADDQSRTPGPTYQEIDLQREGDDVVALAVGNTSSHHFSASFRVSYRSWRQAHFRMSDVLQDRSESRVIIEVADRCTSEATPPEARYVVLSPPICTFLSANSDYEHPEGYSRDWRSVLVWEALVPNNYDVRLEAGRVSTASRVSLLERDEAGRWLVRIAPERPTERGTTCFSYNWVHARVKAFKIPQDSHAIPPWSLPRAIPPQELA